MTNQHISGLMSKTKPYNLIKTHSAVPKSPNFSNPSKSSSFILKKETQSLNKTLKDSVTSKRQIKRETKRKIKEKIQ